MTLPNCRKFFGNQTAAWLVTAFMFSRLALAQVEPSPPDVLNGADAGDDAEAVVQTDGAGVWVAVWESKDTLDNSVDIDKDIFFARSIDNGGTWTLPSVLNTNGTMDGGDDAAPVLATDGGGTWVAAWESQDGLDDTIGTDKDILFARSTDNGATWSSPELLNLNGTNDGGADLRLSLDTAGDGVWIVVWHSDEDLNNAAGTDDDIFFARSTDNGDTWSAPVLLNSTGASDTGNDINPAIATDGNGLWIAAWDSDEDLNGDAGTDFDIAYARSTDNGATWSAPALLNTNGRTDTGGDNSPALAVDGSNVWVAVWGSGEDLNGAAGTDSDIFVARSANGGATWSVPGLLNTNGTTDNGADVRPVIENDGADGWVAAWNSNDDLDGSVFTDFDIFVAQSGNNGANWSPPELLNLSGMSDGSSDLNPGLATDGAGNWVAVWDADVNLNGTAGFDKDILVTQFTLGVAISPTLSGRITTPSGGPATCAVIEATLQGSGLMRVAVTDLDGQYFFDELMAGVYDLRILAPDFGEADAGPVDVSGDAVMNQDFQLSPAANARTISGVLVDEDTGEPLVSVFVEALQNDFVIATTYSCASGEFLLVLPAGIAKGTATVDVRFSLPNYQTEIQEDVTVPPEGAEANESMAKSITFPATLAGVVTVSNIDQAEPIAGARITLRGPANLSATAANNGTFTFPALLGGAYTMSASATGFQSQAISRTVPDSGVTAQSFALIPANRTDINGDNTVNALDVQLVINAALGLNVGTAAADVNGDDTVNALDVQLVINAALGL